MCIPNFRFCPCPLKGKPNFKTDPPLQGMGADLLIEGAKIWNTPVLYV